MNINVDCPLYSKNVENLDHLLINCDLAISVWSTLESHCPNPLNLNISTIDWLEYIYKIIGIIKSTEMF